MGRLLVAAAAEVGGDEGEQTLGEKGKRNFYVFREN